MQKYLLKDAKKLSIFLVLIFSAIMFSIGAVFAFSYNMSFSGKISQNLQSYSINFSTNGVGAYSMLYSNNSAIPVSNFVVSVEKDDIISIQAKKSIFGNTPHFQIATASSNVKTLFMTLVETEVNDIIIPALSMNTYYAVSNPNSSAQIIIPLLEAVNQNITNNDLVKFDLKISESINDYDGTVGNEDPIDFTISSAYQKTSSDSLIPFSAITNENAIVSASKHNQLKISTINNSIVTYKDGDERKGVYDVSFRFENTSINTPITISLEDLIINNNSMSDYFGEIKSNLITFNSIGQVDIPISIIQNMFNFDNVTQVDYVNELVEFIFLIEETTQLKYDIDLSLSLDGDFETIFSTKYGVSQYKPIKVIAVGNNSIDICAQYSFLGSQPQFKVVNHSSSSLCFSLSKLLNLSNNTSSMLSSLALLVSDAILPTEFDDLSFNIPNIITTPADDDIIKITLTFGTKDTMNMASGIMLSSSNAIGTFKSVLNYPNIIIETTNAENKLKFSGNFDDFPTDSGGKLFIKLHNSFGTSATMKLDSLSINDSIVLLSPSYSSLIADGKYGILDITLKKLNDDNVPKNDDLIEFVLEFNILALNFTFSIDGGENYNSLSNNDGIVVRNAGADTIVVTGKKSKFADNVYFRYENALGTTSALCFELVSLKVNDTVQMLPAKMYSNLVRNISSFAYLYVDVKDICGEIISDDDIDDILAFELKVSDDPLYYDTKCEISVDGKSNYKIVYHSNAFAEVSGISITTSEYDIQIAGAYSEFAEDLYFNIVNLDATTIRYYLKSLVFDGVPIAITRNYSNLANQLSGIEFHYDIASLLGAGLSGNENKILQFTFELVQETVSYPTELLVSVDDNGNTESPTYVALYSTNSYTSYSSVVVTPINNYITVEGEYSDFGSLVDGVLYLKLYNICSSNLSLRLVSMVINTVSIAIEYDDVHSQRYIPVLNVDSGLISDKMQINMKNLYNLSVTDENIPSDAIVTMVFELSLV